jgi:hypothetical protein
MVEVSPPAPINQGDIMTARKPTSDEQFEGIVHGDEHCLCQLFDHHGFSIVDAEDELGAESDLDLEDDDG